MAVEFYKAVGDTGGAIGDQISSGVRGALLPKVMTAQRASGADIFRKFYIKNAGTDSIDLKIALSDIGEFDAVIFESASDAEVVGDLTGSETKYGAAEITYLEDSGGLNETVNGAGGLVDIKKIRVIKDTNFTIFRISDTIGMGGVLGDLAMIDTITDLGSELEILLVGAIDYSQNIGKKAHAYISATLASGATKPYWVQVKISANSTTLSTINPLPLAVRY